MDDFDNFLLAVIGVVIPTTAAGVLALSSVSVLAGAVKLRIELLVKLDGLSRSATRSPGRPEPLSLITFTIVPSLLRLKTCRTATSDKVYPSALDPVVKLWAWID